VEITLDQINFVVGDMDAMAAFYRRLGVDVQTGPSEWAPHHRSSSPSGGADVDLDSQAFASVWNEGWPGGPGLVLCFRVPERADVDRLYDELTAAGHTSQQPPYDAFWGSRFAVVADPDGNAVGLRSPVDPAFRSEGPKPPAS
jgi:catechol 2,3-dioxygenase-like lactoylglutathione lyase family enzyme